MSRDWRTILRFAVVAIGIAIVFFVFDRADLFSKGRIGNWMFWASLVACPGYFISVLDVAGSEQPVQNVELMWLVIGLANFVLYAVLGAVYARFRNWRAGTVRVKTATHQ
jgi:hypothetical protein